MDQIKIRGARTHNLKNISVDIPRNQLTVITGLSGSVARARWLSIRFTRKVSVATSNHSRPMRANSCN